MPDEALPGVMGNRGIMLFISGEYKSDNERNRGTNVILGSREHRKYDFGEQGKMLKYFWGTSTPPPPTPTNTGRATLMQDSNLQPLVPSRVLYRVKQADSLANQYKTLQYE